MNRFLAGIFLLCCALPIFPQNGENQIPLRLSPKDAVELAIKNNLMLEQARIGTDIKRRRDVYAWNQFLPTAGISGTLMRENFAPVSQGLPLPPPFNIPPTTLPNWRVTGAFSATLDLSFALVEGMRSIRLDYEAGLLTLDKARLQIEQAVRKMYNSILLLKANAALLEESFGNAVRQAAIAEANFNAGLAPRLNWLQAQVAVENLRPSIKELENNIQNISGNFALSLGLPFDTDFELDPIEEMSFIPPDLLEFISGSAAMKAPDIMELRANIAAMHSQRKALALQQRTPFLRLGWTLSSMFDPTLDPFQNSWFKSDRWNGGGNFSVTLGMNFNGFFKFTTEGQRLADMDANLQMQNLRLAQILRETELEIFMKLSSLERTRSTAEAQQAAVNLAEMTLALTEGAFTAGLQDLQAVRNSSLALDQARLQLLTLNFNFLNDLIDLEYAIGLPFGTLRGNEE